MPTFRSDSSAYTTMAVAFTELSRGNSTVTYRVQWTAQLGSSTANGASANNYRDLMIYRASDNAQVAKSRIKSTETGWTYDGKYSGTFDFTINVGTNSASSISFYIQTNSTGTQSCIWTNRSYCTDFSVAYSLYYTAATPGTITGISPLICENSTTVTWSAGKDGVNNTISSYSVVPYVNNIPQSEFNVGKNTSFSFITSNIARGASVSFRVYTYYQRGGSGVSTTPTYAYKNRVPNTPTSPTVPKTSYVPGEIIPVSFVNNGDPDNNHVRFEAATDKSTDIVEMNISKTATVVNISTGGWQQGSQLKFRVRCVDEFGLTSAWSTYTQAVTMNATPLSPVINYPVAGATVYSSKPHILLTAGATNDGPKHILCINDGSEKTTAANGSYFSCGTNDNLASQRKVAYVPSTLTVGSKSITSRMYDSSLYSSAASRAFTVASLPLTDPDLTQTGMKIKSVHITELQTAINMLRTAYGLSSASWTAVTVGNTKIGNANIISELQTALQAVITVINSWDSATSTFDINVSWINPSSSDGIDRLKLRQSIEQLRSTILLI